MKKVIVAAALAAAGTFIAYPSAAHGQTFGNGLYSKLEYRYSKYEAGTERHQVLVGLGVGF